ncbi:enoyl-CoA hydratase/isomerase family protein [Rhodotorula paludigena]|uniref:enoyl-CoA hydratase/isomerase family protein n=1 Tax=Rhodotorula paludigena TaxID=86838 RepID=UPI00316C757D
MAAPDAILLDFKPPFAIITLNQPKKKNALDLHLYKRLSSILKEVDRNPEIYVTVLTGNGDFFSAGADVKSTREGFKGEDARVASLERLSGSNLDMTRSFYTHSKILVAGLNGPAIGLSAALLGHVDLVYAVENAYFLTPFSAISLVCEGGASQSLVQRMGLSKANEALLLGKKLTAQDLVACGFINKLFPPQDAASFRKELLSYLEQQLSGLELEAILKSKQLIRAALPNPDETNTREVFAGAERFATGKPQERFSKLANKEMKHKL